jgi:hypothetical protein
MSGGRVTVRLVNDDRGEDRGEQGIGGDAQAVFPQRLEREPGEARGRSRAQPEHPCPIGAELGRREASERDRRSGRRKQDQQSTFGRELQVLAVGLIEEPGAIRLLIKRHRRLERAETGPVSQKSRTIGSVSCQMIARSA